MSYTETTTTNSYGIEIPFDVAVNLMDDDIREQVSSEYSPCTDQEFFDAYAKAHKNEFGEDWALDTASPQF